MKTAANGTPTPQGLLDWGLFFGTGGGFAGGILALLELATVPPQGTAATVALTIVYATALGVLLGLMIASLAASTALISSAASRSAAPSFRNAGVLLLGIMILATVECLNRTTFDGPQIASHRFIIWILVSFHGLAAVGSWLTARLLFALPQWRRAKPTRRIALASILGGVAAVLCWADRSILVGHYPALHLQLTLAFLVMAMLGAGLLLRRQRTLPLIALVLLAVLAAPLRQTEPIGAARSWIESKTIQLRGVSAFPESVLDLISAVEPRSSDTQDTILDRVRLMDHEAIAARLNELIPTRRKMNLLIVSLDTLRTDHVGAFGYKKNPTTPVLDKLASNSIRFHHCYTAYPTSSPSYSSFFTGRFPSCAPVAWVWDVEPDWPETLTLAGALKAAGFTTRAETAFNRETSERRKVFGHLRDGFEVFNPDRTIESRSAPEITSSSLAHLKEMAPDPFFLWVHYLDIHEPYRRHSSHDFGSDSKSRYDSEIAWTDAHLGRLLDSLEAQGLKHNTVICVMSDHGEEFGEHNSRFHNTNLYEQQSRVPCVLHVPGIGGTDVRGVVSLTDMLPTLLELAGIDDPHRRSGRSLWPEILGIGVEPEGFAFAEFFGQKSVLQGAKKMVVHDGHKLIFSERSQTEEIYDLSRDPGESKNLIGQLGLREDKLRALLQAIEADIDEIRRETDRGKAVAVDPKEDLRRRMKEIAAQPKARQVATLPQFIRSIADNVFGIRHEYASALAGPLRQETIEFATRCFDDRSLPIALSCLEILHILHAKEALPFLQQVTSVQPVIRSKTTALRGLLGDETALVELQEIHAFEGVPNKNDIAIAMLHLGDTSGMDHIKASLWNRSPLRTVEALQALGGGAPEELLGIVERFLTHPLRNYAPVRLAMAEALLRGPSSPLRDRLLARLSFDGEASVATLALNELRSTHDKPMLSRLLAAAEAEVDGDMAIAARKFPVALNALQRAVKLWPDLHQSLQVKLGALELLHGERAKATEAIEKLRPPIAALWMQALDDFRELSKSPVEFEVERVSGDEVALRRQWNAAIVNLHNTGEKAWLGATMGLTIRFRIVVLDANGAQLPTLMEQDAEIAGLPVPPNGGVRLELPYMTPDSPGTFTLSLSTEVVGADGGVRSHGKPVPFGKLTVKDRLL